MPISRLAAQSICGNLKSARPKGLDGEQTQTGGRNLRVHIRHPGPPDTWERGGPGREGSDGSMGGISGKKIPTKLLGDLCFWVIFKHFCQGKSQSNPTISERICLTLKHQTVAVSKKRERVTELKNSPGFD